LNAKKNQSTEGIKLGQRKWRRNNTRIVMIEKKSEKKETN
jgi:hypothetical protein